MTDAVSLLINNPLPINEWYNNKNEPFLLFQTFLVLLPSPLVRFWCSPIFFSFMALDDDLIFKRMFILTGTFCGSTREHARAFILRCPFQWAMSSCYQKHTRKWVFLRNGENLLCLNPRWLNGHQRPISCGTSSLKVSNILLRSFFSSSNFLFHLSISSSCLPISNNVSCCCCQLKSP